MLEPTPPLADASVDVAASVPEPASTPQPFPGFWQSLGLILLVMACSAPAYAVGKAISALLQALGVPLGASFDLVGKPIIRALPYVVVLWLGARWAGTTWRETYPLRPVRLVWLPMFVVAQAGISAIVAAAASVLEQVLPAPSFLEKLIVHAGPFAVLFLAPLTEEPLHRGLMLGGMLKRYSRPQGDRPQCFGLRNGSSEPVAVHERVSARSFFWLGRRGNRELVASDAWTRAAQRDVFSASREGTGAT